MNKLIFFRIMFFIAIIGFIAFILLFSIYIYNTNQNNKLSENIAKSYSLSYLYSDNPEYTVNKNITEYSYSSSINPFVIGIIKIDKIKLNYPILSEVSDELLKLAPCRFAGPMPNNIGNLCIAGHNYIDNTFFAKISSLENDDEISIYDINGNLTKYYVFDKKEVEGSDTSCTSQETAGRKILTLMTCNSIKQTRILVIAKEK